MKVAFSLFTLAATIGHGMSEEVVCCQTCDDGVKGFPVCYEWGGSDGSSGRVTGTVEYCKEQEFFAYKDLEGNCYETGFPGMAGDCYEGSDCKGDQAFRRPLNYCLNPDNGNFGSFFLWYDGLVCLTVEEAKEMFFGKDSEIEGDPHIKTWGGKWFDYHGECDLVLLNAPEFMADTPLSVHVRTKLRYQYSYVETAALALGDDILEVGSFGEYALNGVESANLEGAHVAGYPVYHTEMSKKRHKFDVVINTSTNITMTTFKNLVAVKITGAHADHFGSATGIMGNYEGELVGRDGSIFTVENANQFGQEWQVTADEPMLFRTARVPQSPQQCVLPLTGVSEARRLGQAGISQEAAQAACSNFQGEQKENCVFDVIAVGDLDMAMAGAI